MKIFISFILFISCVCFAQKKNFNKEAELQKFIELGGKVEETSPNIYKLTYRDGTQRVFNFNHNDKVNIAAETVDTTIINVWEIDTTKYADKFSFWQKVDVVNNFESIVFVDDLNKNGLLELYGFSEVNPPFAGPVEIFEQNNQGIFQNIYSYDSTSIFVQGIGDVDLDGNKEIHLRTTDTLNGKFYRSDSLSQLPTNFDFIFYYTPNQISAMTFGDFDKNGITDCAFIDGSNPSKVIISEFRDSINNFTTVYEQVVDGDIPSGFAIGDFDEDEKTEFVVSTALRMIYVIENQNVNQYAITWQDTFPTYNAYMKTSTNDIDGNGKPEFWIGGQDFENGISVFVCYEADGNNSYHPVAMIELRYLVSLYANYLQAVDVDGDGKDELIISLGEYLIILKFTGRPNYHSYEIFYVKNNEQTQPGNTFRPVTIYDLDGDGKKDILLPMDKYVAPNLIFFSYLLKQNKISSVDGEDKDKLSTFNIHQNYPNPFNLSSKINISLLIPSYVKLKAYNILGKEVKLLLDRELSTGEYSIVWDGTDNNGNILNSGIYLITMEAGNFRKTIKAILLK
ncbi:MAG: T9SS type A sorting domain-containing protein [Bacteroidetes bacterium]|nr:T9SS type A sorting domain-containing protein [Bacteroidota bacterium]